MKVKVRGEEYFVPSKTAVALTEGIERIYRRLGFPTDCSTETGWKMCDELVQLWYSFYPWELTAWKEEQLDELANERTVKESLRGGGYFPISYPTRLYKMFETYLPDQKLNDMRFVRKMVKRHPIFKKTRHQI